MAELKPKKYTTINDAAGNPLRIGTIIKTLSAFHIKKVLPEGAKESDILRIASKTGTIHEISGDKIYVEITSEQCYARIKAEATVFRREGGTRVIGDGSVVRIGNLVQILAREEEVRKLAGTGGWIHGMGEACGKTGRVVRILEKSDLLVQFAWGPRFYFKPAALLQSSSDKVETQDHKNNWVRIGSVVRVVLSPTEFAKTQKKNNLPHDKTYTELPSKLLTIKSIRLKAFSSSTTVGVVYKGTPHLVHVEAIELISSVKDRKINKIHVGDQVQILTDEAQLKSLQTHYRPEFGGWLEDMSKVLGSIGKITQFCIDEAAGLHNTILVKVEFPDLTFFYFDPRALKIFTGPNSMYTFSTPDLSASTGSSKVADARSKSTSTSTSDQQQEQEDYIENTANNSSTIMEEIPRCDLRCFEKLGKGGMGRVVKAEWNKNGKKKNVAVKQVFDGVTRGADLFGGILEEAKIQFSLRHPNIVTLLGISLDSDLWIVMDLVDGKDLSKLLFGKDGNSNNDGLSFKQKVKLSLDMCNAIAYIHHKKYVHCDIKPHNMMVDGKGKLYVCDFGITKFLGNMDFMTFATQYTNSVSGTLFYIAPECLQKSKTTGKYRRPTFASDIWSLGAVFFELFTHHYISEDPFAFVQDKSSNNDRLVKGQILKYAPRQVLAIMLKSLDFNPGGRPSSQDLCEFFHELLLRV